MKINKLEYLSFKMYNPVTGEVIIDGEWSDEPKSLIAIWSDYAFEEPDIKNEAFKKDWETFEAKYKQEHDCDSDFDTLDKFLEEYDSSDWIVFEIGNSGLSCGPGASTAWFVVDKDTIVEEQDAPEYDEKDDVQGDEQE